jgi:hypothetical protein
VADNILKGIIKIEAPGVQQTANAVGASVGKIEQQTIRLTKTLDQLKESARIKGNILATETDIRRIAQYNKELEVLNGQIKKVSSIGKAGFDEFGNAVVANSSKIVSGSKTAWRSLRTLAYILPGIGIAGILGFATTAIGSLFGVGKEADKTAEKLKELIKPLDDIKGSAVAGTDEDLSKVRALAGVVEDQTQSYQRRNRALNELKEINKNYFGDLTLEADKLSILKTRVEEYTGALISQAVIKAFSDEIGTVSKELFKQQQTLGSSVRELNKYRAAAKSAAIDANELQRSVTGGGTAQAPLVNTSEQIANSALSKASDAFKKQLKVVNEIAKQKTDLTQALNEAVASSLDFKTLKTPTTPKGQAPKFEFLFEFLPFDPNGKLKPEQRAKLLEAANKFEKEFGEFVVNADFSKGSKTDNQTINKAKKFWDDFLKGIILFKPPKFSVETDIKIIPHDVEIDQDKLTFRGIRMRLLN